MQSPDEKDILIDALDQLEYYTKEHFTREEELQNKISYPKNYDHLKKHRELVSQLQNTKG